ncbi:hypothetical protein [Acetobacterium bakii]|uniref:CobQ/CobB/MinD/ParA nucleotide binding domain-containing protein n=1 Tax=Acetobacterium bakii TaxID=52689 RepID=A0A0L6U3Q9_9FIRM|nr:hypothetical protein [Acetobacterium bakii]KNZ42410.1 hypothetical protein AKG39_06480 [Acetobacterium bakii]
MEVIGVWGSPGGGKTTLAMELAKTISEETKENVVLIFTEDQASPLSYLFPGRNKEGGSLGKIITMAGFDQDELIRTLVNHPKNKYLACLGYRNEDCKLSYPDVVESQVIDLFVTLGQKFKYAVVDGQSNFHNDWITQYALRYGRCVMVGGGDLKSIAFFNATTTLLQDFPGFRDSAIRVANNPWDFETWRLIGEKYGGVQHYFPYCMDVQLAYLEERSIESIKTTKRNREFVRELSRLRESLMAETSEYPHENRSTRKQKRSKKERIPKQRVEKFKKEKTRRTPIFKLPFKKVKEEGSE